MKISFKATIVILLSPLLAACGGNFYSQSGSSGASRCETLANNYWSEYQAYNQQYYTSLEELKLQELQIMELKQKR